MRATTLRSVLGLVLPVLVSGQACETTTVTSNIPSDNSVALRDYSYCGGTLKASAFIQNTAYNKLVSVYYTNKQNQSTPSTTATFGYQGTADAQGWELWTTSTQVYINGITELLNITFQDTDNRKTYSQRLGIAVKPSGEPAPSPPGPPTPYATPKGLSNDITEFLAANAGSQAGASYAKMFVNINPAVQGSKPGNVVAARSGPSYEQKNPDYEYHWVRDGSLTLDTVYDLYAAATDSQAKKQYEALLFQYASSRIGEQEQPNLTGLGEPKFYLNGTTFTLPWGRPQNDGPATASITLIEFANAYLKNGGSLDDVKQRIYNAPVQKDLAFVADNWQASTFDVWEEVQSTQFYNALVYRRAFIMGAEFATKMGDSATAQKLQGQVNAVTSSLDQFWDANRGILMYNSGQVIRDKSSFLDTAVVLGIIHGYNGDNVYSFTNERVLSTVVSLFNSFKIYDISKTRKDSAGNTLAIPIGRYPEDVYNGTGTQDNGGNPWYLCTASVAELFYTASKEFTEGGSVAVTDVSKPFFDYFTPDARVEAGQTYASSSNQFKEIVAGVNGWADALVRTIKYYTPQDQRLSEQYNRGSGASQGAGDLTWSYAALLTAAFARARLTGDTNYVSTLANMGIKQNTS